MEYIACRMQDTLCETGSYWSALREAYTNLKKIKEEEEI
jgi:hypothetical protein